MKNYLLKLVTVLFITALLSACSDEEINPTPLNGQQTSEGGVTKDDVKF